MLQGRIFARCGRIIARAVITASIVDQNRPLPQDCHKHITYRLQSTSKIVHNEATDGHTVYTTCCGFPKDMVNGPSMVLERGGFGDDACFISRFNSTHVVGVADGVGGWRRYGIDPSKFSRRLMNICSELVEAGEFEPCRPDMLLADAFETLSTPPRPTGSSTACVLVVHHDMLYSANLGDSGYMVMRDGAVICRSREQTHYFNAPFQLSLPPESVANAGFLGDSPDRAELQSLRLKRGDIVVLATDGLWDNVSEHIIVSQLSNLQAKDIQAACNSLALTARRLAFDSRHLSPFAVKASLNGIDAPGGKPDDITLVLLFIA